MPNAEIVWHCGQPFSRNSAARGSFPVTVHATAGVAAGCAAAALDAPVPLLQAATPAVTTIAITTMPRRTEHLCEGSVRRLPGAFMKQGEAEVKLSSEIDLLAVLRHVH